MAENAAAPAEARQRAETQKRTRQTVVHSTPLQPTQGYAQGSDGFLGYTHKWMFTDALVQHRYHSWACLKRRCVCTETTCAWWDVQILWHGGDKGIMVRYVDQTGKQEQWKDIRTPNPEKLSNGSVAYGPQ